MRTRFLGRLLPALLLAILPMGASAGMFVGVSVDVPPPPLPIYAQPPCPQPGFIWVPGYWAWGPYGYYWVPGTWVLPPQVGLFWTPGYWGWDGDAYLWHSGYWGPSVGFYGGIDYGFGYDGDGFDGGYWNGGIFFYNRAVMNVGPRFDSDDYYRPERHHDFHHRGFDHVSFNGGPHGIRARPDRRDLLAARERHFGMTAEQRQHVFMARGDRVLRAHFNHGRPPIAATALPRRFQGHGVLGARAAGGPMLHSRAHPVFRHAPADRPAWAAARRDRAPNRLARAPQFRHGTPQNWAGTRFGQRPGMRNAAHPQPRPAPRFQYHQAPRFQARGAPHFNRYRVSPQRQAAPRFRPAQQFHPVPHFRPAQQFHPVPHFRPAPQFRPARGVRNTPQFHQAPRFRSAPRGRPHPGPRRPPRWR